MPVLFSISQPELENLLGLAGSSLAPGGGLAGAWWSLLGPDRAQPAARRDSRVPGKILLRWN